MLNSVVRIAGESMALRAFGFVKIPLITYLWPTIVESNDKRSVVKIPLTWRSKNHMGSMYFGALAVGADLAVGLPAIRQMQSGTNRYSFLFKDARFNFLKRPEGDVHFICEECDKVADLFAQADASGERHNLTVYGYATVPSLGPEKVAEFWLTMSAKAKG